MALSDAAAREIARALRKHVGMKELEQVVTELVDIPGDKDFRDSIERLVHALRMVSDR
jgi:L-rhamnose isomerase